MAILELEGVSKGFGGVQAVADVSFTMQEGEILSLIGPNGAGKTTLLNLVSGFYRPDSGQIRFAGARVDGLGPDKVTARGIARTFQSLRLFNELSVLENVLAAQHYQVQIGWLAATMRLPRYRATEQAMHERAVEALGFFGPRLMGYRLHQPVHVLSYANRRRVEMARAMASGARLLLLDEPSAGMNPRETAEITELIQRMRDEKGYTILLVEHKMGLIERLSDRVIAMNFGRPLAEGSFREVVTNSQVIEAYLGRHPEEAERMGVTEA